MRLAVSEFAIEVTVVLFSSALWTAVRCVFLQILGHFEVWAGEGVMELVFIKRSFLVPDNKMEEG